ncbi:MAG: cytochrome-c oxidase, cbb3-type subunit I, partial [Rhizobiales bacterium]|nr:cytochrome-c oxidase, cbb3-type subunit I [Hyphomicrobiales bacterium]
MPLIAILGIITFLAVVLSALAHDGLFAFHMALVAVMAGGAAIWRMRTIDFSKTAAIPLKTFKTGYADDVIRAG